jgi:D-alanine-D-alanine ligase
MGLRERVLVLYNEPVLPADHPDYISEAEVLDNVEAVATTLAASGFAIDRLGIGHDPDGLLAHLQAHRPDAIFNLYEGAADCNVTETYVAGLMDWLGIPYTGCPYRTLFLAQNKHLTKYLLQGEGVPTAPFLVADSAPLEGCSLRFPLIVKPAQQDASVGVDQGSVVTDLAGLNARLGYVLEHYGAPALVEEFIRGRELTMALVEVPDLRVLPMTEAVFPDHGPDYWPILTYDAKWTKGSKEYETTDYHFQAELSAELAARMEAIARKAFRLLGARDYARVDFRVRGEEPFVLELNPNPSFAPDRGLANNLWAAGITHGQFTEQLVRNALARGSSAQRPARWRQVPQAS